MSAAVYADTSFFYALIDEGDPGHSLVADLYGDYDGSFVLSSYVFAETISLLTKRFGKYHAMAGGRWIQESTRTTLLHPGSADFEAAWKLFVERPDSGYDLVDALSFGVMHNHGLRTAFSLDGHFAQMGFTVRPGT